MVPVSVTIKWLLRWYSGTTYLTVLGAIPPVYNLGLDALLSRSVSSDSGPSCSRIALSPRVLDRGNSVSLFHQFGVYYLNARSRSSSAACTTGMSHLPCQTVLMQIPDHRLSLSLGAISLWLEMRYVHACIHASLPRNRRERIRDMF